MEQHSSTHFTVTFIIIALSFTCNSLQYYPQQTPRKNTTSPTISMDPITFTKRKYEVTDEYLSTDHDLVVKSSITNRHIHRLRGRECQRFLREGNAIGYR